MFDYAQRLQLSLKDTARRSALKAAAGLVLVVALGFLIAALWSFLAHDLGWGPALASLAVGILFAVVALILFGMGKQRKHEMPTTEDLRKEVEARVTLATDAAVERARAEADRVLDLAGNKAVSLMDDAGYRVNKLADDTEKRVYSAARNAAQAVGLTASNINAIRSKVQNSANVMGEAGNSNTASMAKLIGAFAVGITLASKLKQSRSPDNFDDDIL